MAAAVARGVMMIRGGHSKVKLLLATSTDDEGMKMETKDDVAIKFPACQRRIDC